MLVGTIKEITRHPVKSFTGEQVTKTKVMKYGLYGDRSHAFLDKSRPGKFLTITQVQDMVKYKARFIGEESNDHYPDVEILSPSGKKYKWNDIQLQTELEQISNRPIQPIIYPPTNVPIGPIEEDHLLIITDASITKLASMLGANIDHRRFRPNLYIALHNDVPFIEEDWIGKTIQIGEKVKIKMNSSCERCMIITVNPEDGKMASSLLKTVVRERQNRFGVLGSVSSTGSIKVGDSVHDPKAIKEYHGTPKIVALIQLLGSKGSDSSKKRMRLKPPKELPLRGEEVNSCPRKSIRHLL
ncbi:MOSC domain-containing protein [Virgibacillus sp. W0430]|uniref:MOSC domain-containing protein n=1 Tax=Virgibacillus sp. W0430 TaxID=3391580 RepID=UPI003F488F9E